MRELDKARRSDQIRRLVSRFPSYPSPEDPELRDSAAVGPALELLECGGLASSWWRQLSEGEQAERTTPCAAMGTYHLQHRATIVWEKRLGLPLSGKTQPCLSNLFPLWF